MLKLLLYGYSYGIRSSRKLERACCHNLSFIWLAGGLKPDFKTIAEFRRSNRKVLKKALKQCARLCMKLGLVEGSVLFVDGSKFRADANIKNSWDMKKCEDCLTGLDKRIEDLLSECGGVEEEEKDGSSLMSGTAAGYNVQSAADRKHGLTVNLETANENNDKNQLARQTEKADEAVRGHCLAV